MRDEEVAPLIRVAYSGTRDEGVRGTREYEGRGSTRDEGRGTREDYLRLGDPGPSFQRPLARSRLIIVRSNRRIDVSREMRSSMTPGGRTCRPFRYQVSASPFSASAYS